MSTRRSSPRRRYNAAYHQMGDHTLFHNGSTAKMFPALSRLQPAQLSEMFNVPVADKTAERFEEVRFSEPYKESRPCFRQLDSPVRDEQQNRIISRGGVVSMSFTNSYNLGGTNGSSHATAAISAYAEGQSRPGTALTAASASRPASSRYTAISAPPAAAAGSSTGGYNRTDTLRHYALSRPTTANSVYSSDTVRLHGSRQFKVHTPSGAKETLMNTIPSINIGFDVDETLHQAKLEQQREHRRKQCVISSFNPMRPRGSDDDVGGGDGGGAFSASGASKKRMEPSATSASAAAKRRSPTRKSPPPPARNLVYKPFSTGTEAMAKGRLTTNWYLNNGPSPIQAAIDAMRHDNKIDRENRRVARQRYGNV